VIAGYAFIAPQLVGFLIFVFLPIAAIFWVSLLDWQIVTGRMTFVGAQNYVTAATADGRFPGILRNTGIFILGYVPVTVAIGLALAILTDRPRRGMRVYRAIYFMPVVISLAAWAIVWRLVFQPEGPLNQTLRLFGIGGPRWLSDPSVAMTAVIAVAVLKTVGFTMVLFHAALQTVPRDTVEAATIDGANAWNIFRYVTLPAIAPFTFLVLVLTTINSFKTFALFFVMTNGGPGDATRTLSFYIYDQAFRFFRGGYAGALSAVLFAAVLLLTVGQFLLRRRWVHHER
jgi:multiple sugar transport system permease protein